MGALFSTKYLVAVGLCEAIPGILLLIGRYVPLALTIVGPVIVNILLVAFLMYPQALGSGAVVTILWFVVFWWYRASFAGIFEAKRA